jgi:hypothetical protein
MSPDPPSELRGVTSPKPVFIINRADLEVISSSDPNMEKRENKVENYFQNKFPKICSQNLPFLECTSGSSSGCQISKNKQNPPEGTPRVNLNPIWGKSQVRFLIKNNEIIVGTDDLPCLPRDMKNCLKTCHPNKFHTSNGMIMTEKEGIGSHGMTKTEKEDGTDLAVHKYTESHVENNPQPEIFISPAISSTESPWTLIKSMSSRDI